MQRRGRERRFAPSPWGVPSASGPAEQRFGVGLAAILSPPRRAAIHSIGRIPERRLPSTPSPRATVSSSAAAIPHRSRPRPGKAGNESPGAGRPSRTPAFPPRRSFHRFAAGGPRSRRLPAAKSPAASPAAMPVPRRRTAPAGRRLLRRPGRPLGAASDAARRGLGEQRFQSSPAIHRSSA